MEHFDHNWCSLCHKKVPVSDDACDKCLSPDHLKPYYVPATIDGNLNPYNKRQRNTYYSYTPQNVMEGTFSNQVSPNAMRGSYPDNKQTDHGNSSSAIPKQSSQHVAASSGSQGGSNIILPSNPFRFGATPETTTAVSEQSKIQQHPYHGLNTTVTESNNLFSPQFSSPLVAGTLETSIVNMNHSDGQQQPPQKHEDSTAKVAGSYNFSILSLQSSRWCYKHHHAIGPEGCTETNEQANLTCSDHLHLTWDVQRPTPLRYGQIPTLYEGCMDDLKRFSKSLRNYSPFVENRDRGQEAALNYLELATGNDEEFRLYVPLLRKHIEALNCLTAEYIKSMTLVTMHCYVLLARSLLQKLHQRKFGTQTEVFSQATLDGIPGWYVEFRQSRATQESPPNPLPKLDADLLTPGLWEEYIGIIDRISNRFRRKTNDLVKKMRDGNVTTWMKSVKGLNEVRNRLLWGGISTNDYHIRADALPTTTFNYWNNVSLINMKAYFLKRNSDIKFSRGAVPLIQNQNQDGNPPAAVSNDQQQPPQGGQPDLWSTGS